MRNAVKSVEAHSPAKRGGLKQGDVFLSINGQKVTDVLDYMYLSYDAKLDLTVLRNGKEKHLKIRKGEGEDMGIEFEEYLMDKPHSCANNCIFCFVDQTPKGMRDTLYFKDDDVRLSFLTGSYITLTNLSEREVKRIIDLKITPINISVHASDPELRCKMLGSKFAGRGLEIMKRFAEADIEMNCQIVCCPGVNDGDELDRTMRWLESMYPAVNSVSVIPVGLTKHREGLYPLKPFDKALAEKTLDQVDKFSAECYEKHGTRIFFCSDEMYLKAGREIPPDEFYEAYPQLENGVGLLRLFETEFDEAAAAAAEGDAPAMEYSIATGMAAVGFISRAADKIKEKYPGLNGTVYSVRNDFFGESVDVAGLITGQDLLAQLKDKPLGEKLFISARMLRSGENVFLDDMTTDELSEALGVEIVKTPQDGAGFFKAITSRL